MPIMSTAASHEPAPTALDIRMFKLATVALSYVRMASRTPGMSAGDVAELHHGHSHHPGSRSSTYSDTRYFLIQES